MDKSFNPKPVQNKTLDASSIEEKEKMEFLQKTLQESYELKIKDFDSTRYNEKEKVWEAFQVENIERISKEKNIEINKLKAFQSTYDNRLIEGELNEIEEFLALARQRNLELVFKKECAEIGFQDNFKKNLLYKAEKIQKFAEENGIQIEATDEIIQQAYDNIIEEGNINYLEEIEKIAEKRKQKLELKNKLLEVAINTRLINVYSGSDIEGILGIIEFAKEKGIKLEIDKEAIQKCCDFCTESNQILNYIDELENIALFGNTKLDIKNELLQKSYDNSSPNIRLKIQEFAEKRSIKLDYNKKGVEIDLSIPQGEEVEVEEKIELNEKEMTEKEYINIIHNTNIAHAGYQRDELLKKLKELSSDLTYQDVINMDYLDYIKVPDDKKMAIEKIINIENVSIKANFYGEKKEYKAGNGFQKILGERGKFILGLTSGNNLEFAFDSTLGEHQDIGAKYKLKIIGGGWIEIDEENKKIKIFKTSQDFGMEPREISQKIVSETFPDYELTVETENK